MVRASDIVLILVALLFPPISAAMITGCSCDLLINVCLTILGFLPGTLHAFWLIYKKMKAEELYGEGGYTYLGNGEYQGHANYGPGPGQPIAPGPGQAQQPYYGSTRG